MDQITLPAFRMPFPATGGNPHQEEAGLRMWAWAEEFGLCTSPGVRRRMLRTRSELWCALTDPTAGPGPLALRCQWTFWAFVVDDAFDDDGCGQDLARSRAAIDELTGVVNGVRRPTSPAALALADLWRRTRAGRSSSWQRTFRADVTGWLWTYWREAVERAAGHTPLPEDYLTHRRHSIGMGMFLDLFETPPAIDLPEHLRRLPALLALRGAVVDHIALYNDICSARKEGAAGYYHNAVFVLRHHRGGTVQQAVTEVDALRAACVQRAVSAEEQLPAQLAAAGATRPIRAAVQLYAGHHRSLLRGDFEYHARAERYRPDPEAPPAPGPLSGPDVFTPRSRPHRPGTDAAA
ncbi:terpene synthase family protein [Kitasatospora sp. NPDC094011]|uniref:terpene synthase family protein n=1 Tax=Kitasatospora sp. NPDC094011 TaxID=3364090 RepID=UPI0037FFD40C